MTVRLKILGAYARIVDIDGKGGDKSMKEKERLTKRICLAAALTFSLTGCGNKSLLDPGNPVSLTVWHYYNGSQQAAFDSLVEEFNTTVGREKGIYVQG